MVVLVEAPIAEDLPEVSSAAVRVLRAVKDQNLFSTPCMRQMQALVFCFAGFTGAVVAFMTVSMVRDVSTVLLVSISQPRPQLLAFKLMIHCQQFRGTQAWPHGR